MHSKRVFEWQHEFVIYSLMSNDLESLSLKYISLHGKDMSSIEEVKKKIGIYVENSRICEGYIVLVSAVHSRSSVLYYLEVCLSSLL